MSLTTKATGALAWVAGEQILSLLVTLVVFLALARLLTPEDFGLVALASLVVALMVAITDLGFSEAIIQREGLEPDHLSTAFWSQLLVGILLGWVLWMLSDVIADLLRQEDFAPLLAVLGLALPLAALSAVPTARLRRQLKFRLLVLRSGISLVCGGVVGITLALNGGGAWSLVAQQLTQVGVAVLVLWIGARWTPTFVFSLQCFRDLSGFGMGIVGTRLTETISRRSDDALIGATLGATSLGLYNAASRLVAVGVQGFSAFVNQVAYPVMSQVRYDEVRLSQGFLQGTQLAAFVAFPTFLGVSLLAEDVVATLLGPQWDRSVPILQALVLLGLVQVVAQVVVVAILACGHSVWNLRIAMLTAGVRIVGFGLAFPFGLQAIAVAFVVGTCLIFPVQLVTLRRLVKFDYKLYWASLFAPFGASLCMAACILAAKSWLGESLSPAARVVALAILGAACYVLAIWAINRKLFKQVISLVRIAKTSVKGRGNA